MVAKQGALLALLLMRFCCVRKPLRSIHFSIQQSDHTSLSYSLRVLNSPHAHAEGATSSMPVHKLPPLLISPHFPFWRPSLTPMFTYSGG